ncbi:hypothetical protein ONS95_001006 [Cadophora gregata]|uniref:uncharacterized protein n=1 Tax=Cadophora gregata TaxID=51156 RepID=UPI0026DB5612|nr:uncharacterized protein ONS95_001006 [Cadophora gregata]KAK0102199.1 hypothetical protein ONS96_006160 [Cadophora gregata f. sp. sojae]KAK0129065.1 hypothetical protein ONS95_001006 [Cadophora gregata]
MPETWRTYTPLYHSWSAIDHGTSLKGSQSRSLDVDATFSWAILRDLFDEPQASSNSIASRVMPYFSRDTLVNDLRPLRLRAIIRKEVWHLTDKPDNFYAEMRSRNRRNNGADVYLQRNETRRGGALHPTIPFETPHAITPVRRWHHKTP